MSESKQSIISLYEQKKVEIYYGESLSTNASTEYERLKEISYSQTQNSKTVEEKISNLAKENQKMKKKLIEKENLISKMKQTFEHYENLLKKSVENLQVLAEQTLQQKKALELSFTQLSLFSPSPNHLHSSSSSSSQLFSLLDFVNNRLPPSFSFSHFNCNFLLFYFLFF